MGHKGISRGFWSSLSLWSDALASSTLASLFPFLQPLSPAFNQHVLQGLGVGGGGTARAELKKLLQEKALAWTLTFLLTRVAHKCQRCLRPKAHGPSCFRAWERKKFRSTPRDGCASPGLRLEGVLPLPSCLHPCLLFPVPSEHQAVCRGERARALMLDRWRFECEGHLH